MAANGKRRNRNARGVTPGIRRLIPVLLVMAACGAAWQGMALWSGLPAFILPPPENVLGRLAGALADGTLLRNAGCTLIEVAGGMLIGMGAAAVLGYLLGKSRLVERVLSPYIVATQAIPTVAIAPLLMIWLGTGLLSKVLICALIVFFPVLVNTAVGMRTVSSNLRELMRSLGATPWQTFRLLELPAAMPVVLGGLKIGATLSVIGAVVGEFIGADRGLGFLISVARGQYDTALVFVGVFTLIAMALGLYGMVALAEAHLLAWRE